MSEESEELSRLREELTERDRRIVSLEGQVSRYEDEEEFISGCAHDLGNFIGAVILATQTYEDTDMSEQAKAKYLKIMTPTVRRCEELIKLLRGTYKHQPRVMGVNDVVDEVYRLVDLTHPQRFSVEFTSKGDVEVNQLGLARAVKNLLINASKASHENGRIHTITFDDYVHAITVKEGIGRRYGNVPEGSYAIISVRDQGQGIKPEHLPLVFGELTTFEGGTGNGLKVVQRVLQENNGYFHIETQEGKGTTFSLYFPLIKELAKPSERRVLVLDDEPVFLELVSEFLRKGGYRVSEASDLASARAVEERIDVVLADTYMSEGERIWRCLKDQYEDATFFAMSATQVPQSYLRKHGIMGFFHKPFSGVELVRTLRQHTS